MNTEMSSLLSLTSNKIRICGNTLCTALKDHNLMVSPLFRSKKESQWVRQCEKLQIVTTTWNLNNNNFHQQDLRNVIIREKYSSTNSEFVYLLKKNVLWTENHISFIVTTSSNILLLSQNLKSKYQELLLAWAINSFYTSRVNRRCASPYFTTLKKPKMKPVAMYKKSASLKHGNLNWVVITLPSS